MKTFKTLSDFKRFNREQGYHFFEHDANRFFNTRFESRMLRERYFITSEQFDKNFPRQFSVRRANDNGSVTTVPHFQAFNTLDEAKTFVSEVK